MKIRLPLTSLSCLLAFSGVAQKPKVADWVMITIFFKHQQDKNLDSLQAIQKKNKFGALFPPAGVGSYPGMS